jgi:hypothetical protein
MKKTLYSHGVSFTTDVSPEPVILQIQDNGNELEEEATTL